MKAKSTTTAIVLAGGFGTRLRSLVSNVPKPMAPIQGRPFLELLLNYWQKQGINKFILAVGYLHETIIKHFGSDFNGSQILYSIERQPLGTGGALHKAGKLLEPQEHCFILNGDTFFEVNHNDLCRHHSDNNSDWSFALFRTFNTKRYSQIKINELNMVKGLGEQPAKPESEILANGGVYISSKEIICDEERIQDSEYSLELDFFPKLARDKRLFGFEQRGMFIDIGVPEDYIRAQDMLYRKLLNP